jgi:hypothetical protein
VRLVENPPRANAPIVFRLSDSVLADVGGRKEYIEDEFNHRNGFLTGTSLSSGGIAVIDWTKLRIFDIDGKQVAVNGKEGNGPGQFLGMMRICRTLGDTLIVFDGNLRRVTIFASNGFMVRQFPTPLDGFMNDGCFNDGTFAAQTVLPPLGDSVPVTAAVRMDLFGKVFDTVGVFPSISFRGVSQYVNVVVRGQSVYVSDPRKNEVRKFDAQGRLQHIVRMADAARPMTPKEAEQWLGGPQPARSGDSTTATTTTANNKATWPFYRGILVDGDARLWVRDFPATDSAPDRWTAYDSTGVLIGALEIPRVFTPRTADSANGRPTTGGYSATAGFAATFIDAKGDYIVLLERDAEGAVHFRTRTMR